MVNNMEKKSALLGRLQTYVSQLEKGGNCFVPLSDIWAFVGVCDSLEIPINGGATVYDKKIITGQYFYI